MTGQWRARRGRRVDAWVFLRRGGASGLRDFQDLTGLDEVRVAAHDVLVRLVEEAPFLRVAEQRLGDLAQAVARADGIGPVDLAVGRDAGAATLHVREIGLVVGHGPSSGRDAAELATVVLL